MLGAFGGSFGGSGVKKFASVADLPFSGVRDGTLAHVEQNLVGESALYLRTSGGWYKVATVNLAPSILQGPDASYTLPNDGSALVIELSAEDPEGLPIEWSFSASTDLTGIASVDGAGQIFVVSADPAAVAAGENIAFGLTFTVTDGVSVAGATSSFTLSFNVGISDPFTAVAAGSIFADTTSNSTQGVVVMPGVVLVGTALAGVAPKLFDVSDPSNPTFLSTLPVPAEFTGLLGGRIGSNNAGMILLTDNEGSASPLTRFFLFDCSDPTQPQYVSLTQLHSGRVLGCNDRFAVIVHGTGNKISTIAFDTGLVAATVDNPVFGLVSSITFTHPVGYAGSGFAYVWQSHTGLGNRIQHVQISESGGVTFSNSPNPGVPSSGMTEGLWFDGRYAYILGTTVTRGLQVWDFEVPSAPVLVFSESVTRISTTQPKVLVIDGFLYAMCASGTASSVLHVYDVSDPNTPTYLGDKTLPYWTLTSARFLGATTGALLFSVVGENAVSNSRVQLLRDPG